MSCTFSPATHEHDPTRPTARQALSRAGHRKPRPLTGRDPLACVRGATDIPGVCERDTRLAQLHCLKPYCLYALGLHST